MNRVHWLNKKTWKIRNVYLFSFIFSVVFLTIIATVDIYMQTEAFKKEQAEVERKIKQQSVARKMELANCILEQSENAITPTGYSVSILNSPTHSVDISTNDPIKRIHMYITPAEVSNSGNSVTHVLEKDGGFSDQISHTFTPGNPKGTYNVEIAVEFYGAEGKTLYKAYQIYVDD